jgi:hypothetical protein
VRMCGAGGCQGGRIAAPGGGFAGLRFFRCLRHREYRDTSPNSVSLRLNLGVYHGLIQQIIDRMPRELKESS